MLRWMILTVSLLLWAACMALIYVNFKPAPRTDMDSDSRSVLERMFAPGTPTKRAWKIYVEPSDLEEAKTMLGAGSSTPENRPKKVEWNGVNERGLVLAGRLESNVKNKRETSLDEDTTLSLTFPGTPFSCNYKGAAHITSDKGLETCKFGLILKYDAFEIEAVSSGNRDGDAFTFNTLLMQNGNQLYKNSRREILGGKTAPSAEMAPFLYKPDINVGSTWDIRTIDFNQAMKGGKEMMNVSKVTCTRRRRIVMEGNEVAAFEVRSENGEARAWYSADGEVLKQSYKLAGLFEIMVVKEDKYNER